MTEWLSRLAETMAHASAAKQLCIVFLGGLLTSMNPCVLVAAPLVVGFAGGTKEGRHHPMVLSGVFVLGLASAFTALGLVAAMTGSLLGDVGWYWKALWGSSCWRWASTCSGPSGSRRLPMASCPASMGPGSLGPSSWAP